MSTDSKGADRSTVSVESNGELPHAPKGSLEEGSTPG
jgi:hypothetical protein